VHDDHVVTAGTAPGEATVRELAGWLDTRAGSNVIASASVAQELPGMEAHRATASGVLSFALPGPVRRRLLWFRPELVQTVSWGGDPNKPVELDAGTQLHPRRSFALWREELRLASNVAILTPPTTTYVPIYPKKSLVMVAALIVGPLSGIVLILLQHMQTDSTWSGRRSASVTKD
jgi:hypothetical protein